MGRRMARGLSWVKEEDVYISHDAWAIYSRSLDTIVAG